jgi:hypothetical protein
VYYVELCSGLYDSEFVLFTFYAVGAVAGKVCMEIALYFYISNTHDALVQ